MIVKTIEDLNELVTQVRAAQKQFAEFPQEQVDIIFRHAAQAANENRITLAKMAVEETGMGIFEDKVIKNHFASEFIYNKYIHDKTCGVVEEDEDAGIIKIAEPIGIIAGIVPTTNPTSTAIFKSLITLKTRNAIIFSPHPRAKKCTIEAARTVLEAAVAAGAPEHIIGWIDEPSVELSAALMQHPDVNLTLATGGPAMVKAAYSSGKPAIGVGAGNTPAIIDETCHLKMAVNSVLLSKSFDNGMICASEQSVIVVQDVYDAVKKEFALRGAHILTASEKEKVANIIMKNGRVDPAIVGQPAYKIAAMAGLKVPETTKVLIGEIKNIAREEPFAHEKLSPVLAMLKAKNFDDALRIAGAQIELEGMGHTAVLYTDQLNQDRIRRYGDLMKTGRVLVNMPASQGAIGDIYNFRLEPSLTLGCGSWGGNAISENVGVKHLINIKTVAQRRENMLWFQIPNKIYFKQNAIAEAFKDLEGKKRAFIVTDKFLYDAGYVAKVTRVLDKLGIGSETFSDVKPDPDLSTIYRGLDVLNTFKPDVIIAVGGGSPIDAAKIMWLMYEQPNVKFSDLSMRFMDIRKRIYKFPEMGKKAFFVAVPTTSGTGSEVTPFAVVTDDKTGAKYPIADYALTPHMAVIDLDFVKDMPKKLTAYSGIDALVHAIEAYVSVMATDFTNGLALEAIRIIFKYLPASFAEGAENLKAREKMAYASTMAGMAFANAFLGVCHSMAHKLGSLYQVPHGLANAILLNEVIRFNAVDAPTKQAAFPQYKYPNTVERYARIADYLGLGGKTAPEKVEKLIAAIEELKKKCEIPATLKEVGIDEKAFLANLEDISIQAFDDQCTGGNPRYPLVREIEQMYKNAYYGA
ncbi:MAG TPA: bifunctional acetaldehyde-CoA/alcohol dehydrogenase [Treponemataceae bacterium]|jgi:acetaldehyde dehydrogenase/alcohol dehydrogenase|nr:MAG: Aldehyde-alcohol dehydrogenase [Spirochaetes bacterium ADurb.Bin269]HOC29745.1 bifunctional acetaldehyde-CoA/alcohol dehydrogenase [Treponemataceae bacterium]HQL32594.1 bifunctional acetaldehyde-CoA/alcohol dehydrogenase [Treponemataceae bacterium]